jgi:hypothetical protein
VIGRRTPRRIADAGAAIFVAALTSCAAPPPPAPTALAFRGAESGSQATGTNTLTIARPTGVVDGDLLVAAIHVGGGAVGLPQVTAPGDWTLVRALSRANDLFEVGYRFANGGVRSFTFTTDIAAEGVGVIIAYGGADPVLPLGDENARAQTVAADTIAAPSINVRDVGAIVLLCAAAAAPLTAQPVWRGPSGYVVRVDASLRQRSVHCADTLAPTLGLVTPDALATSAAVDWALVDLFAVRPRS